MPPRKKLAVVPPNSRKPQSVSMSIKEAADTSERALLVALRDRIAVDLDKGGVPPHALAPLTKQLREIAKQIEAIDAEDADDDISAAAATADEEWTAT